MTSSDLLDTALALQLAESTDLLTARCEKLLAVLREHALAHRATLRVGRTHGIHAEPDVWGHRVADFAFAIHRCRDRLLRARQSVAVGKLSGPVGTYSNIDPAIEAEVLGELGLRPAGRRHPGGAARRDRRVGQRAGPHRHGLRRDRDRDPARPADRGGRAGRAVRRRPEGLIVDAAQAEPGEGRANQRAGPDRARSGRPGDGGHPALARARYLALLDRARRAARCRHRH